MAFLPNSTIYLCRVPFDSTQKNQVFFKSPEQQREYFISKQVDLLISYNIVRKTLPDGSLQSRIRVANRIDDLRAKGVNYLCYQNAQHGAKWFYCFVEQLIYVSENCTELIFETDVFQTWLFDTKVMDSFIVREHSATDEVGENIVPETFSPNNFDYNELIPVNPEVVLDIWKDIFWGKLSPSDAFSQILTYQDDCEVIGADLLDDYCYLLCGTGSWVGEEDDAYSSENICGIPQGYTFAVAFTTEHLNQFATELVENREQKIDMVVAIPKFSVKSAMIYDLTGDPIDDVNGVNIKGFDDPNVVEGEILGGSKTAEADVSVRFDKEKMTFGGYKPKNNKMFTAPYFSLNISNHNGTIKDFPLEFFGRGEGNIREVQFKLTGDISPIPSVYLIPKNFLGVGINYDQAITISDLPQISLSTDSFKLWLARNQGTLALQTISNVGNMAVGGASMLMGNPLGATQLMGGVAGTANTLASVFDASKEPDSVTAGGGKNYLILANGENKFVYRWKKVRKDYAKVIDDFFTMYGYAYNTVRKPYFVDENKLPRESFCYIETQNVNITGRKTASGTLEVAIPNEDMKALKEIYNNGVTLWNPNKEIGNYALNNECVGG